MPTVTEVGQSGPPTRMATLARLMPRSRSSRLITLMKVREIWGDVWRSVEIFGDIGRYGLITFMKGEGDMGRLGRYGEICGDLITFMKGELIPTNLRTATERRMFSPMSFCWSEHLVRVRVGVRVGVGVRVS